MAVFIFGLVIYFKPAIESVDEQGVGEAIKQTTGVNTIYGEIVPRRKDLVTQKCRQIDLNHRRHQFQIGQLPPGTPPFHHLPSIDCPHEKIGIRA